MSGVDQAELLAVARSVIEADARAVHATLSALNEGFLEVARLLAMMSGKALVTGSGSFRGRTVALVGHQKGRDIKERHARQFGMAYREAYHFKNKWTQTLAMAMAVYPAANVEVVDEGVILKPSRPPVAPKLVAIR